MRKLPIFTMTIGSILVLISQAAFSNPVVINADENTCTFLNPDGVTTVTVTPPDKIKVVQRGKNPPSGTCQDEENKTDDGRPIFFEGTPPAPNVCTIVVGSRITAASYTQKIDKKGTTLTCKGVKTFP